MKNKIKIGILIGDIYTLSTYQTNVVKMILSDSDLELALLIRDGRKEIKTLKTKIIKNIFSSSFLSNIIFKIQCIIENKMYLSKRTINKKNEIVEILAKIPCLELYPKRKGFVDLFSDEDAEKIIDYDLDLILRHEFNIIRGKILTSAKYGIWSFHHGDNAINRGGPAGFWEIVLNEPYVGVTLQQLTSTLDGGNIIDKAYYNWSFSHVITNNDILQSSVVLLKKNINKLKEGKVSYNKSLVYFNPLYKKPTLKFLFIYLFKFYGTILDKVFYKIVTTVTRKRKFCWSLYFSKGIFMESQLFNKKEINMPKNEFWADPFLIEYHNELYAFFENYEYTKGKGKISCAKIIDNQFTDIKEVLCLTTHLSYPFIVKEGDDIFLIPETLGNKKLEVYKCLEFPTKWELYSTAFENEEIVDTTYYKDENDDRWLILNKGYLNKTELYIYKIDSLKFNTIEPHKLNPVIIDNLTARNGGAIFKYNNEYYRPSQVNSHGKYGNGLNINRIVKLNLDEYVEEKLITVEPKFKGGLVGLHHLHQLDNNFIFDVCQKLK